MKIPDLSTKATVILRGPDLEEWSMGNITHWISLDLLSLSIHGEITIEV
jgi:hypothetical protein